MTALYEGTREELDYACTKLRNMVDDFYYYGKQNMRFTPDINAVVKLEDELDAVELIAHTGYEDASNWKLVTKYISLANEFRFKRSMR